MGFLITLEGPDGCGKSTQLGFIRDFFEDKGYDVIVAREPGGTAISEKIREILLDTANANMDYRAEMLLYAAARAQLVSEVIKPSIDAGKVVIMDRFVDSLSGHRSWPWSRYGLFGKCYRPTRRNHRPYNPP